MTTVQNRPATPETAHPDADEAAPRRRRFDWGQPWVYLVALVASAVAVGPVAYVWINGFRTTVDINQNPAGWPNPWTADNYLAVLTSERFWGSVFSSTVIATGTTLGVVALGVMAAFAIARMEFRGRGGLYSLFAAGLMFPVTVAALPLSILLRQLDLQGTFLGVIIPQVGFQLPTTIIILVPFLRAIPHELEEAASIDGASRIGFFWRILLPLSRPVLATVSVLAVVGSWNAFLLPLVILTAADTWTLPLGVTNYSTQYTADTARILAFTTLSMVPALVLYAFAERHLVRGLTGSAIKG